MIRTYLRRHRLARRLALRLIARHGAEAHALARSRAIAAYDTPGEAFAWRVVAQVERALGVRWQPSELRRAAAGG